MVAIDGGSLSTGSLSTLGGAASAGTLGPAPATTSEERLTGALRRCVARWGFTKTTVEDIAREAGMSRATAYRVFPGGKSEMLAAATLADATRLAQEVSTLVATAPDLASGVAGALHHAAVYLDGHDALRFVREHEPVLLDQFLGFDSADTLLVAAGELLGVALERFLAPGDASEVGTWLARIVLSYTQSPSPTLDLARRADVDLLVASFLLPGMPPLRPGAPSGGDAPVPSPPSHPDPTVIR